MKRRLLYFLLGIAAALSGCIKGNDDATPVIQPQGKFTGQYYRVHRNNTTQVKDTIKANLTLDLTSNTFTITGDTSKHAGSKGTFNYNQSYIEWIDSTVPVGTNSLDLPKYHLHGLYQYVYNGSSLEFAASTYPIDTLIYIYKLKK
ncbi:hypothetical protein ACFQ3S_12415 [Mucilaginibacter terrae]|uniref:hypothetical protein n=1 Tax=Mucilaginibacter terrae TaxID=1955052 RepID=UPI0036315B32